ncbi:glycine cleavage system protein H [Vaginisenegalia massiliensis]|uniref:glycine cleavage system protein H n=1 Tax=Vaginisenegalia massiliensis TaxID=2058294 RepID=UPI000F547383|nr:glycine cleavage system protein H [Vaginisenegalia massiliensis]
MIKQTQQLWLEQDGEIVTIGLTPSLQDEAGDIAYASIAPLGKIEVDDTLLVLEASKASIEVASPLSGQIVERNQAAEGKPSLLNETDSSANWLVKMTQVDTNLL